MRSEIDYIKATESSYSLSDMCRYFNILPLGGNIDTMKHAIARYKLDTSHFKNEVSIHEKHGATFNRNITNKKLLIDKFGYVCSNPLCSISEWNDNTLTLQVDHIDGNNTNDDLGNLRLLCPNCHYETDTYCVSSNINPELSDICGCGKEKQRASSMCSVCLNGKNFISGKIVVPKKYKKEDLISIASNSFSFAEMLNKLGKTGGGSQSTIKNAVKYYNIDVSHFHGQSWNKGKSLADNPKTKRAWKNKLVIERGHKCEQCNRTHWVSGNLIPLELEHVDGNNKNNERSNLKLLCCNCHSQTKTWKRKKSALNKPNNSCIDCEKEISPKAKRCLECLNKSYQANKQPSGKPSNSKSYNPNYNLCDCGERKLVKSPRCVMCAKKSQERVDWPEVAELKSMVAGSSYTAVGRLLGVSDNAVRKHIRNHSV